MGFEYALGHPAAFMIAMLCIVGWIVIGPLYFGDTWHVVLHTVTATTTFIMVFLIQNTEHRDSAAIQLKLDELIRTTRGGRNAMLNIEELSLDDLENVRAHYKKLASRAREREGRGLTDTEIRDV
jgi:low affinity Fe/Cu permease